jgi:hypothetical protein
MTHEQTLAYLAGFFDGEGCVYIFCCRRQSGALHFHLEASISNSGQEPLLVTARTEVRRLAAG